MITITSLKKSYAADTLRPTGLVRLLWKQIEAWNDPALFIHLPPEDELLEDAARIESLPRSLPLWGVPFVVKDNIDVADWPTTAGCPEFAYMATRDAEVVRRLREAGAIPIAKGNLDQFATGLVGVRSPYGIPRNAYNDGYLPGGSSSGSASALAAGLCAFSLGTDTAGSGRVPAAFQNLIGWKPTRGLLSGRGVVPACRALDCVSVFTHTAQDSALVAGCIAGYDAEDPFSREIAAISLPSGAFRFGVPRELDFEGDPDTPELFVAAVKRLEAIGGVAVEIDLTPFTEAAKLLYEGPWVAERWAAVGEFVESHPDAVFPVTRQILEASRNWDASATFKAQYRLHELMRESEDCWHGIDVLLLPTTPRLYPVSEVLADPIRTNSVLGRYTNFMNLLDLSAVAVPAGFARGRMLPWGITLAAPAGTDGSLIDLAGRFTGKPVVEPALVEERIPLAVCGAHLEGLALHHQLAGRGARLVARTRTAAAYRLFAMPAGGGIPARPAMVRDDVGGGAAIEVEVWSLRPEAFAGFVAQIPGPLGIGKILLDDGSEVPGFIAEPRAMIGSEEITSCGGWRAFLKR